MSGLSRIFKPWRWHKKKKTSEKIEKRAADLERKISERSSREELVRRGVLKELDDNAQPNDKSRLKKAVVDPVGNCDWSPLSVVMEDDSAIDLSFEANVPAVPAPVEINTSSSTSLAVTQPLPEIIPPFDYGGQAKFQDPSQLNQFLPPNESDACSMGHYQKINIVPVEMKQGPHLDVEHLPSSFTSESSSENGEFSSQQHILTHQAPYLQFAENVAAFYIPPPPTETFVEVTSSLDKPASSFEEVYAHEPDLSRQPFRSALKGGKNKGRIQQQLEEQLQLTQKHGMTLGIGGPSTATQFGSLKKMPPKVAPKPGHLQNRHSDPCNKENMSHEFLGAAISSVQKPQDEDEEKSDQEAKIRRRDSLSRFLLQRPQKNELFERNIIPIKSEVDRIEDRQMIETKLSRRLSLRPTFEELEEKHILLKQSPEELEREKEEKKKILIRKLSFRPTIDELKERKIIKFNDYVEVTEAEEYDRKADKPWTRLTPRDKAAIRKELNEFKSTEMDVHEESRHFTRFHRP